MLPFLDREDERRRLAADGAKLELDIVAAAADGSDRVLVAEAKRTASAREVAASLRGVADKAARCPALRGRQMTAAVFVLRKKGKISDERVLGPNHVIRT